jgi:chromate transport protein ChrA
MSQFSNETIAEQSAMLVGIAIMLLGLLSSVPGVVFATGFAMVFGGKAFSCFTSLQDLDPRLRFRYTLVSALISIVVLTMVAWIVWDYTQTVVSFSSTIGLAFLGFAAVYFLTRSVLSFHRNPNFGTEGKDTEP